MCSINVHADMALGPEHPNVPRVLDNYAELLRETDRADEAAEMEARAKAIRAKYERGGLAAPI